MYLEKRKRTKLVAPVLFLLCLLLVLPLSGQNNKTRRVKKKTIKKTIVQDTVTETSRPKVAVVLSGGGAKGAAHIGALKVIEQAGIPIDMVVGTSMGALMGGLYSIGYSADMLDSLVREQNWDVLLFDKTTLQEQQLWQRDKYNNTYAFYFSCDKDGKFSIAQPGLIKGKNLAGLFSRLTLGYHDSLDFNSLPIPFSCVATDMVGLKEVDFHSGNLATAMRASMSIPLVFNPVTLDSMILVDGGLTNNFPVDLAKRMGADIVIGVTVQDLTKKKAEDFTSMFSILNQMMDINTSGKFEPNRDLCDVFIRVNIDGYSAASFTKEAIDTLINRGHVAAMSQWDNIVSLKQRLNMDDSDTIERVRPYRLQSHKIRMKTSEVNFTNISQSDINYISRKYRLYPGSTTTLDTIEKVISTLKNSLFYNDASYQVKYGTDGYKLDIETEGKKRADVYLGIRADNEEIVSMQVESLTRINKFTPMIVDAVARVGKRSMLSLGTVFTKNPHLLASLSYTFRYQDVDIAYKGKKDMNTTYRQHRAEFKLINVGSKAHMFDIGLRWDYYYYYDVLMGSKSKNIFAKKAHTYSYHVHLGTDTKDDKYFATEGGKFDFEYGLYTDDFCKYLSHAPLHVAAYQWQKSFSIGDGFVLTPMIYGRHIYGRDIPAVLSNYIGGENFSHYFEQQMPMIGVGKVEMTDNNFSAVEFTLRKKIKKHHYVSLNFALAESTQYLKNFFTNDPFYGVGLSYSFSSLIGPLQVGLSYSNKCDSPYFFVSAGYEF